MAGRTTVRLNNEPTFRTQNDLTISYGVLTAGNWIIALGFALAALALTLQVCAGTQCRYLV
ncbi:MAG TPA: hypothetical protein VFC93_00520 [Chloroflexota bacterium]|nr:hypothetical protein [Chloroflexota bacterium]